MREVGSVRPRQNFSMGAYDEFRWLHHLLFHIAQIHHPYNGLLISFGKSGWQYQVNIQSFAELFFFIKLIAQS